jgi:hypothetical protein
MSDYNIIILDKMSINYYRSKGCMDDEKQVFNDTGRSACSHHLLLLNLYDEIIPMITIYSIKKSRAIAGPCLVQLAML